MSQSLAKPEVEPVHLTVKELDREVARLHGWERLEDGRWFFRWPNDTEERHNRRWHSSPPQYSQDVALAMELFVELAQRAPICQWFTIEHPRGTSVRVGYATHETHMTPDGNWQGCFYFAPLCIALMCAYYEKKTGVPVEIKGRIPRCKP